MAKDKDLKFEVWANFKDSQYVFLATEQNGQPRVRPVTLVFSDQRFWVLTGTNNAKIQQIRKNPKMEFCLLLEKGEKIGYIRAAGSAKIISDRETKAKVARNCEFFSEFWKSPDDPNYALLELRLNEIEYLNPDETVAKRLEL